MSKKNKIKVVPGKGKNIKISDIKEHLEIEKPQDEIVEKDKIIIPTKKDSKKYRQFKYCLYFLHSFFLLFFINHIVLVFVTILFNYF